MKDEGSGASPGNWDGCAAGSTDWFGFETASGSVPDHSRHGSRSGDAASLPAHHSMTGCLRQNREL
jgi:hypothetical protein